MSLVFNTIVRWRFYPDHVKRFSYFLSLRYHSLVNSTRSQSLWRAYHCADSYRAYNISARKLTLKTYYVPGPVPTFKDQDFSHIDLIPKHMLVPTCLLQPSIPRVLLSHVKGHIIYNYSNNKVKAILFQGLSMKHS